MNDYLEMRRVPLDGVFNFRSLGGYAAGKDKKEVTKHGVFYRSSRLHGITEEDKKKFHSVNIKTVVDLRTSFEISSHPDDFLEGTGIHYVNIDVMPEMDPDKIAKYSKKDDDGTSMSYFYQALLDTRGDQLAKVFHTFAERMNEGAALFHCSIGRDRTGVVSALLLSLAEVDERDIIVDYQVSETYLEGMTKEQLHSPRSNMVNFINHLNKEYGGALSYMEKIGLSKTEISIIKAQFVQE